MKKLKIMTASLCVLAVVGCTTKQGTYSAIGAGGGALLGGIIGNIIGKDSKATAIGAAIGAALGSGGGALIGHHMDKVAQEVAQQVPNAKVDRVDDGNGLEMVKVTFDSKLQFDLNSYSLKPSAKNDLTKFAKVLKNNSDCDVNVYGHTDKTGTDAINIPLSKNRAQSVASFLENNGVSNSQIRTIKGFGSDDPVKGHENTVNDEANRRVEVYLYASDDMIKAANNGTLD